jgi:hypothetical protein
MRTLPGADPRFVFDPKSPVGGQVWQSRLRGAALLLLAVGQASCSLLSPDADRLGDSRFDRAALVAHVRFLAADSLYGRAAGSEYERRAADYIRDRFAEDGLRAEAPEYFQVFSFTSTGGDVHPTPAAGLWTSAAAALPTSQNVLASLPGSGSLADQWVIVGAHYDHLGFRASGDSVIVFNGADDNASGVAVMLEVARVLRDFLVWHAGADRRSIMFQAYGAEEVGLLGSSYFTQHPTVPPEHITAVIILDMVGRMQGNTLIVGGRSSDPGWPALLDEANGDRLVLVPFEGSLDRGDQYPFLLQGTAVLSLFTGMHSEYHTPFDDVELLNFEGMEEVGGLTVDLVWELAVR